MKASSASGHGLIAVKLQSRSFLGLGFMAQTFDPGSAALFVLASIDGFLRDVRRADVRRIDQFK